ncbi:uncharacterized protein LOC107991938 [Cucumis melo]|uniref:Uncharacterized protein LOC107991938 n=1 Tax=Cucumis melo TaxID=3656 RepID=A0ABM3KC72_CUCME|nr:uncharacterized protein LOC107991938 [Cucumis melo]
MDSTDMELECDGSCEASKIARDEDTDGKGKTIDVDLDSYGREDVPNPPKIRKNVKQSMVWDHFERLKDFGQRKKDRIGTFQVSEALGFGDAGMCIL